MKSVHGNVTGQASEDTCNMHTRNPFCVQGSSVVANDATQWNGIQEGGRVG